MADVFKLESSVKLDSKDVLEQLKKLDDQFEETADSAEKSESKFTKFSKGLGDVSKNLGNAGKKIGDFGSKLTNIGGSLSAKVTAPLGIAFGVLTKGTEELRMDLSKLEANVTNAGASVEKTNSQFKYLSAITGEADSSIEALSNLLSSGLSETQMQQAVDNLSGAIIKFPDTLKIESLADSLQETLATGQATGQYGELLERLGVNLDSFNTGLQEATVSGTEQQYALDVLAKNGMANLNEEYKKNNEEAIKNAEAQQNLQMKFAELGAKLTPVLTALTEFGTKITDAFLNLDEGSQNAILKILLLVASLGPVLTVGGNIAKVIGGVSTVFSTVSGAISVVTTGATAATPAIGALAGVFTFLTSPIGIVIAIVTALIAIGVLLWKNWDTVKEKASELGTWLSTTFNNIKAAITNAIDSAVSSVMSKFDNMREKVSNVINAIKGFFSGLKLPEIKIPHIKLPHFSLTGSFSLAPPSIPKIGVDWYSEGAIFTRKTVLANGVGVGDANKGQGNNAEAVIPLDILLDKFDKVANRPINVYLSPREIAIGTASEMKNAIDKIDLRDVRFNY
ncbi:hypothetical protein NE398_07705 [Clostridium tertium]|uniref:Phage-related minor tail protein n=1 Tax=Clostridium tertium TaxID=1559 RepID=A0A9X3XKH8_9CLOT|nr:hypothetical protein [Clostridium tertium]MDC4240046.1 hypothetical protein [Clostridium tertium]